MEKVRVGRSGLACVRVIERKKKKKRRKSGSRVGRRLIDPSRTENRRY